jgi:hypothetical protein
MDIADGVMKDAVIAGNEFLREFIDKKYNESRLEELAEKFRVLADFICVQFSDKESKTDRGKINKKSIIDLYELIKIILKYRDLRDADRFYKKVHDAAEAMDNTLDN